MHHRHQAKLRALFYRVFCAVQRRIPISRQIRIRVDCELILRDRSSKEPSLGRRAFMHTGHHADTICIASQTAALDKHHIVGLFLHELGHLLGRTGEPGADLWVMRRLGIPIEYRGKLGIEWVSPEAARSLGA